MSTLKGAHRLRPYAALLIFLSGVLGLFGWLTVTDRSPLDMLARIAGTLQAQPAWLLLAFLLRPLVLFPISLLVMSTGALIGAPLALALAWSGQWLSAASAYLLAERVLPRHWAAALPARLQPWQAAAEQRGFHAVLMMRLTLVPFDLANFGAAWMRVPRRAYLMATAIGILPSNIAICSFGAAVDWPALLDGQVSLQLMDVLDLRFLALSAALLLLSVLGSRWLAQRSRTAGNRAAD